LIYEIGYKSLVSHDLRKLDKKTTSRILSQINEFLSKDASTGNRLQGEFAGLYKVRIGEYCVIYTVIKNKVLVLRIKHRSQVYDQ
jgi:mRNA interferase RelE/StbE